MLSNSVKKLAPEAGECAKGDIGSDCLIGKRNRGQITHMGLRADRAYWVNIFWHDLTEIKLKMDIYTICDLLAGSNASMPSRRSRAGVGIPSRGAEKCSRTLTELGL